MINSQEGIHSDYLSHHGVSDPNTVPDTHKFPLTVDELQPLLALLESLKNKKHLPDWLVYVKVTYTVCYKGKQGWELFASLHE